MEEKIQSLRTGNERSVNKFILAIITVIDAFLFVGYISDYMQGNISFVFMFMVDAIVLIALVSNYTVYFMRKDSVAFKYLSVVGYMVVYALAVFGAQNDLVFMMVFPITVIYILYYNLRLILGIGIVFGAINLIDVVYIIAVLGHHHSGEPLNSTSLLLQGASVVVYMISLCGTTIISNRNNEAKLSSINEEKDRSSRLLQDVLQVVAAVKNNSNAAAEYINGLRADTATTATALNDISAGNGNNADSISKQTVMTNNIQEMIQSTKQMAEEMLNLAEQSSNAVGAGKKSVDELKEQSEKTTEANRKVTESVASLIRNAKDVEEITAQIFSISNQTNLLALNASIESARAGDAGRGFAVVADEIRQLADETRKLTEDIRNIVEELQGNADIAKNTVDEVVQATYAEHELIRNAGSEFTGIGESMDNLNTDVQEIYGRIEEILESNNVIVDSISQISAVSEEVSASTAQAAQLGDETSRKALRAGELMEELMETVKAIDKYV